MDMTRHYHDLYGDESKDQKIKRLYAEIERFREALFSVKDCLEDKNYIDAEMIIDNALQQKEKE